MRNHFIYGGIDSRNYGIYISGDAVFNAPRKVYDTIAVPGRNGDLIMSGNRMENIELAYPAFSHENFRESFAGFKSAMLALNGYQRLEDSYYPEEFRRALFRGEISVKPTLSKDAGQYDVKFYCDPRRFLKTGELKHTIAAGGRIENPTAFDARPLIRVTGYGDLQIGDCEIEITQQYAYVDIDSEMMDCYHGTDNANSYVSFSGNDFPVLAPGRNTVAYSGNITKVEITPHWWRV